MLRSISFLALLLMAAFVASVDARPHRIRIRTTETWTQTPAGLSCSQETRIRETGAPPVILVPQVQPTQPTQPMSTPLPSATPAPKPKTAEAAPAETLPNGEQTVSLVEGAVEALDEVNARRAQKGLYPFVRDPHLTIGAAVCARHRATYLMFGHTSNDFAGLPQGATAVGSGCAAWEPSWGWGSCCSDDVGPRYAGAAWVMGRDGKRYMHLFVR
jgi:hypothetical protein